jgi:hypothetical protein
MCPVLAAGAPPPTFASSWKSSRDSRSSSLGSASSAPSEPRPSAISCRCPSLLRLLPDSGSSPASRASLQGLRCAALLYVCSRSKRECCGPQGRTGPLTGRFPQPSPHCPFRSALRRVLHRLERPQPVRPHGAHVREPVRQAQRQLGAQVHPEGAARGRRGRSLAGQRVGDMRIGEGDLRRGYRSALRVILRTI